MAVPAAGSLPNPQLLDELSAFFRLLSEPARLQLLRQRLEQQLREMQAV
jgi:hypothetical protein